MRLGLISLFLLALSVSTARASCTLPNATNETIAGIEALACSPANAREAFLCGGKECPSLPEMRAAVKAKGCAKTLRKYACTVSPWKNFTLPERYDAFMELAETVTMPKTVTPEVLACIAVRETMYLDPLTTTCYSGTASGLGHVLRGTFEGYVKEKGGISKQDWLKPYNCQAGATASSIFNTHYQRDPLLQINTMARILGDSSGSSLRMKLQNYNGSSTKVKYAAAVMDCVNQLAENSRLTAAQRPLPAGKLSVLQQVAADDRAKAQKAAADKRITRALKAAAGEGFSSCQE